MAESARLDVVCIGSATEDVFVQVADTKIIRFSDEHEDKAYLALEYGAKIRTDDVFIDTGGGATNTAATFEHMGLETGVATKVGADGPGDRVIESLQQRRIDTTMVVRDPEHRTGYSVILTGFTGDRTILVHRGASAHLREEEVDWESMGRTSWVYMNSLAGESAPLFLQVARFCGQRGIDLAINPGGEQRKLGIDGLRCVLEHTDLLVCNRAEAYEITGVEPDRGPEDEKEMLEMFLSAGCRRAVITYGRDGSEGMDHTGHYKVPAPPDEPVSTVGAGDAFAAACTVGLHRGLGLPQAMRCASANAGSVVQHIGAKNGIISWDHALAACGIDGCQ